MLNKVNKGNARCISSLNKYPCVSWMISVLLIGGIGLLPISLLCNIYYPCSNNELGVMLTLGIIVCFSLIVYVMIPCIIIGILNCIYKNTIDDQDTRPRVVVSRIPPPPKSPPPRSASKSFSETYRI
jgi:hypothetical protein